MPITPGTRIGPYEVISPLGAGGMGEVYRARDSRLGRDVAIKALPPGFAQDADRLARFEREARLLASLSHPNIAGIHGLEEAGNERYLVLEFVEGETLAARIARGPLPLDDVYEVGKQIATGLETAHENGIVHRDLKPGNVMITPAGAVKVLDFGLARAGATESSGSDPNLSASPTMSHLATQAGVILGTAAYMSPEQARGRSVDRRTDIWSFGCVLYECLAGHQAFEGETVSDLVARILEREPDWSALPPATPGRLQELLRRCLRKDPRERLRDIGEARVVLDEMSKGIGLGGVESAPAPPRRLPSAFVVGIVIAAALVSAVVTKMVSHPPAARQVALSVALPAGERLDGGLENNLLALSSDGRSLVYAATKDGKQRLMLRSLDDPEPKEIPGTSDARNPFFSPDGEWVGFFAGGAMQKVSVRGGKPVTIAEVSADRSGAWLSDNTIVYSPTFSSPLYRIDANGGAPYAVTSLDSTRSERTHRWPCVLPGEEWVVFTVGLLNSPGGYDDASIDAVSLKTGERREIARGGCARFAPPDHLIIARGGSLYAIPLDPHNPRSGATAVPVLDGVRGVSTSGIAFFDIARDGTLAFVPGREADAGSRLAWVDRDGKATPIPGEPRNYFQIDVSPDGTRALAEIGPGGGGGDVFIVDLARGTANQITFGGHSGTPRWLPDGEHIAYSHSTEDGQTQVVVRSLFGDDSMRVLATSTLPVNISSVSPDGSGVLFNYYGKSDSDVMLVPIDGQSTARPIVEAPGSQTTGVVSPDLKWVAYQSDAGGRASEVWVQSVGNAGRRSQISTGGGGRPMWSPDSHELYYLADVSLVAAKLVARENVMLVDSTRVLFAVAGGMNTDGSLRGITIHPNGRKFLVRVSVGGATDMNEVSIRLNWAASLGKRSKGGR